MRSESSMSATYQQRHNAQRHSQPRHSQRTADTHQPIFSRVSIASNMAQAQHSPVLSCPVMILVAIPTHVKSSETYGESVTGSVQPGKGEDSTYKKCKDSAKHKKDSISGSNGQLQLFKAQVQGIRDSRGITKRWQRSTRLLCGLLFAVAIPRVRFLSQSPCSRHLHDREKPLGYDGTNPGAPRITPLWGLPIVYDDDITWLTLLQRWLIQ